MCPVVQLAHPCVTLCVFAPLREIRTIFMKWRTPGRNGKIVPSIGLPASSEAADITRIRQIPVSANLCSSVSICGFFFPALFIFFCIQSVPLLAESNVEAGIRFARIAQYGRAIESFRAALKKQPEDEEARFRLAQALILSPARRKKDLEEASLLLRQSISFLEEIHRPIVTDDLKTRRPPAPDLARRYFYQGLVRWALEDRIGALHGFEAALAWNPVFREAAYNRASVLLELGQTSDATMILRSLYRPGPTNGPKRPLSP